MQGARRPTPTILQLRRGRTRRHRDLIGRDPEPGQKVSAQRDRLIHRSDLPQRPRREPAGTPRGLYSGHGCRRGCRRFVGDSRLWRVSTLPGGRLSLTESSSAAATSALSRRIYATAHRSLRDVDATIEFAGVIESGTSVPPSTPRSGRSRVRNCRSRHRGPRRRDSACVLLRDRAKPMKDPDLIAAGLTVILALVIGLALRAAGIVPAAPLR